MQQERSLAEICAAEMRHTVFRAEAFSGELDRRRHDPDPNPDTHAKSNSGALPRSTFKRRDQEQY